MRTLGFLLLAVANAAAAPAAPQVAVPGWEISLFASEPQIVTPIGIAVDRKGRIFVVESHTHRVRPDYAGPKSDRVKILEDTDGDGVADKSSIFAEGFTAAMNLAFDPAGVLHLVHRNGVLRLEDTDHDDVCEKQAPLLTLDTAETYPHNGLGSLSFSTDGWLYIGSGENMGQTYTATAADGVKITHTPGGANVFRMKPDGSQLSVYATGMWNAFVLATDGAGRVFVGDNDPDSRPPCRFLHVTEGADFGYRFQYGRSGLHPFICWNGELPGTVPMMAGTGEAPTGIVDARFTRLGAAHSQGFLISEWGDSTLSWFKLQPRGASFSASREVVIRGEAGFRPACLAAAPDGSVYFTDWADREYSVHGKGRIWHLKATTADAAPGAEKTLPVTAPERRRDELARSSDAAAWPALEAALTDLDPFITAAALTTLQRPVFRPQLLAGVSHSVARVRLGCLLALRRSGHADAAPLLRAALQDGDAEVRRLAMTWAAELRLKELRPLVEKALTTGGDIRPDDFSLWLAAMDLIARDAAPTAATAGTSNDEILRKILDAPDTVPGVKVAVVPMLADLKDPATIRTLVALASDGDLQVRRQAVRSLASVPTPESIEPLRKIASDESCDANLRMDAISALSVRPTPEILPILPVLTNENSDLATTTARALRVHAGDPTVKAALEAAAANASTPAMVRDQLHLALGIPSAAPMPADDAAWQAALMDRAASTSVDRGRQVFFSTASMCSNCHVAEGRGVVVGPNLGTIARSSDRARLIQSILEPSREIGPLYGTKVVTLKNGSVVSGVQAIKDGGGNLSLLQPGGKEIPAARDDIAKVDETAVSLMPEGLENSMTLQDFRDLLAYLETLK